MSLALKTFATTLVTLAVMGQSAAAQTGTSSAASPASPAPHTPAAVTTAATDANKELHRSVISHYAQLVHATYADLQKDLLGLSAAVSAFIEKPSPQTHATAKSAWVAARKVYGLTEAFRFYGGPIDDAKTGPEGLMNAWPLDEAYLDYVKGQGDAGIINRPGEFPEITRTLLVSLNEKSGEKNISTGFHAVEFLLWGQDFSKKGPGTRTYRDYVDTGKNNAKRRATTLKILTDLLVEHGAQLVEAWKPNTPDNYASAFVKEDSKEALRRILMGLASLSADELAGERMTVALEKSDQENEQSCFSDTTTSDLIQNGKAIQNVYLGSYDTITGPGVSEVVKTLDPELDKKIKEALTASVKSLSAIPSPFDNVISAKKSSPARAKVTAAIDALMAQAKLFAKVGKSLGVELNIQE